MESQNEYIDLRQILHILKKHLWLIVITTICCGILGYGTSKYIMKPLYQSDATLIVNPGSSQSNTITYDQVTAAQQLVGTYAIIMKSNTVLNQVIQDLQLDMDANALSNSITVEGVNETEVIQLSVKSESKDEAKKISDKIIEVASPLIIKSVKAGSVEVISPTQVEKNPVSPNGRLNTVIALLLGLCISVVLAFVIEFFKNTLTSDDDIKRNLGINVLGVIPHYELNG